MCGIAGIFDLKGKRQLDGDLLSRMNTSQIHRGNGEGLPAPILYAANLVGLMPRHAKGGSNHTNHEWRRQRPPPTRHAGPTWI